MQQFVAALPWQAWFSGLDGIRVAGSKGKGSVSAIAASILTQLGIRTGLYTSPHLFRFHERVQIDGDCIGDASLTAAADWAFCELERIERAAPDERVGAFEAITAAAFHYFGEQAADAVVCEAGLGGRYDSTRVLPGRVTCLTSVELEHTELLGGTLELIAYDKADLCREGGVLVTGKLDPEVMRRLRAYCGLRRVEMIDASVEAKISDLRYENRAMRFHLVCGGVDFGDGTMNLLGDHQAANAAVAVLAVQRWLAANRPDVTPSRLKGAVLSSLACLHWPGRLQRIYENPEICVDVGHTPQSLRAAAAALQRIYAGRKILLVTGVSGDKNIAGVLQELVPIASEIVCTRAHHKGAPVETILAHCERLAANTPRLSAATIELAVDISRERALAAGMVIVIAGGLFLAIEAVTYLNRENPCSLRFF